MKTYKKTVSLTVDAEIEVEWSPGSPGRGPSFDCAGGEPGDPPEAFIVAASVGGVSIPLDAIDRGDLRRLEDEALEGAMDAERDAFEAAAEDRADAAREEKLLGTWDY